ncbi:MAG: aldehyde dehydrogenase [Rikenellaceae bacterium]|nr:aldehyde dehydrogenase [Rikenellaceae bacterium]
MAITNTPTEQITGLAAAQKQYFRTGQTLDISYRLTALRALKDAILKHEKALTDALWADLHKSYEEAFLTEISIVLGEIDNHISNLRSWASPVHRPTPLKMFPSRSRIVSEPLGTTLIIAPWNYPVQLLLNPLVGAISAGCTAILKPSPYVPTVARALEELIADTFESEYVATVQGNRDVNTALLAERYDLIFFTGSPALGRTVMAAAAKNLTPVVLELGGKSPCIVDYDADIEVAARRIAWGKCLNAGQTCIAPDYLLVHSAVKDRLIAALGKEFKALLGEEPQQSKHFVRIVNERAFDRLVGYFKDGDIVVGGKTERSERFIAPTILDNVNPESAVMQEEIFGPIFPVVTFQSTDEAVNFVTSREKPLALYYFGKSGKQVIRRTSSGGACINDTIMHIANENMPFGGVGNSGMSSYHGKNSFDVFSHQRAVVTTPTWLDLPFRYMPYKLFSLVKKIL